MSRRIWEISKEKEQLYRKWTKRLAASGADLDLSTFDAARAPSLRITQVPETLGSYVRMSPGGWLYVVGVRIVALAPKVVIQRYDLSSSEEDVNMSLPDDPTLNNSRNRHYRFPDGSEFLRDDVLNHRVGTQGTLRCGDVIEGWLLGQCFESGPERYSQRRVLPICLSIMDQFDAWDSVTVNLHVDRAPEQPRLRPSPMSTLFELEDVTASPGATPETPVAGMVRGSRSPIVENRDAAATSTGPRRE